jgi:four helix bundle protein
MAAMVLNSPEALAMSVYVVRAFVSMRERLAANEAILVLRSGTSVGAHYREACRAKSNADFVSKVEGALQELDETLYWLELLQESCSGKAAQIGPLAAEANELISIFVTVTRSVKALPATK